MFPLTPEEIDANDARCKRATVALAAYAGHENGSTDPFDDSVMTDLLCDMMHWCDKYRTEFDEALRLGKMHYEAEVSGDD